MKMTWEWSSMRDGNMRKKAIVTMMVLDILILGMMSLVLPSFTQPALAQWAPSTTQSDPNGGKYNWSISIHNGTPDEPAKWAGELDRLGFYYDFQTMLNSTELVNGTTITMKGDVDRTIELYDIYVSDMYAPGPADKNSPGTAYIWTMMDPVKFAASGYNVTTIPMSLDINFNISYLKAKNISEITIRFNATIDKWAGGPYYAQPLVTKLKIFPDRILTQDETDRWWNARGPNIWNNWYSETQNLAVTTVDDGQGGRYNWTAAAYTADQGEPQNWTGKTRYLFFEYTFSTRLNYSSVLDGATLRLKGAQDRIWGLDKLMVDTIQPPLWGYYFTDNNRTVIGLEFNVSYIEVHNISEIVITFNQTIVRWDGARYFSQSMIVSKPVTSGDFISNEDFNWWSSRPYGAVQLFSWNVLTLVFLTSCIPLVLIWALVAYIEARNKTKVKEHARKKPKKIDVGPNGVAETIMKLMDRSEFWMDKKRNFILSTTALTLVFYFFLTGAIFLFVSGNWTADIMLRRAVLALVIILSWSILAIFGYWYNKFRAEDLGWKLKIRTLKKREGDYLADLK